MMNILTRLQNLNKILSKKEIKHLHQISQAMLAMSGRVTMLGISRWTEISYRTVQRFFNGNYSWTELFFRFIFQHLFFLGGEYLLAGDESVITKSGKKTHGLDYFFSGLLNKVTKGIAVFALSLISVDEGTSYPLQVQQVIRTKAEKKATKTKSKKKSKGKSKQKVGRPKGKKNRDKTLIEWTPEMVRLYEMVKKQLLVFGDLITVRYLALDGHFGNNNALQTTLQAGLHLISKLRYDSALYFLYEGKQKKNGRKKKYGSKIDYQKIPKKYLVKEERDGHILTRIYQVQALHKAFAQRLNVVIITRTNLKSGAFANVNLFTSDLDLSYDKIIKYYSLRFQIEFNFRDAKQYWGLEDFMNINEVPVTNAINLSFFMINLSQALLKEFRQTNPKSGVIDLKAYYRAAKYFEETIKRLPKKPDPILLEQIFGHIATLGAIHNQKSCFSDA